MNAFARALAEKKRLAADAQHAGRRRHAETQRAEQPVEAACSGYAARGTAFVVKQHAPTTYSKQHSTPARRLYFRTDKAGVDFAGFIAVGSHWPVPVAFEVKMAASPSLRLAKDHGRPLLDPHQAAELRARDAQGTIAGLLIRTQVKPRGRPVEVRWHWLCWSAWCDATSAAKRAGKATLDQATLEKFGRPVEQMRGLGVTQGAPDWAPAAIAAWQATQAVRHG